MNTLTIGQAAARLNVSTYTLRYYERAGLVTPVARGANGHRRYSVEDLEHLRFLHCLRATEMPIRRIREFAESARQGRADAGIEILRAHRHELQTRIEELQELLGVIDQKIDYLQRKA
jgi:DNA-binding transcriptional MerR regulator